MKILATATEKQLIYIGVLLERHDEAGTLEDVIVEIDPDLREDEEFMRWAARQSIARASEVIEILKENLSGYR
jgi:hypothetical protein